jgi:hypothetical protein
MKTTTPHGHRASSIMLFMLTLLTFIIFAAMACQPAKKGCRSTWGMGGYSSTEIKVELPEEIIAITCDRDNPEPVYAYRDTLTNTVVIGFQNY